MNIRDHPFLWQWDRNRSLAINEPGALYVDFDRPGETPDRRKVVDGIAEISDTWLQKAGPKNIYICIQSGTLIGYTLLVRPRPKPADYVTANNEKYEALEADMLQRIADTDADLQTHKKAWAEEVERETAALAAMAKKDRQNAEKAQAGIEDLANAIDATYEGLDTLKSRVKSMEDWVKSLDWVPVVKPVDETLLPETTLDYDDGATFTAPMPTVGLTYTVTIGEKTYEAEAWEYTDSLNAVCIGKYILSADSTDTFVFAWGRGSMAGQRLLYATEGVTDGKVTVSIARKSENENELPDVFLWSLKKRVAKNESAISDTSTKITELEESVNTATDDVSSMKTTVKSLQTSLSNKADKSSPVFTGSFSQNRKEGTTVAYGSHTEGLDCQATDRYCHAEGYKTAASGANYGASHAEGYETIASGDASHAEGLKTTASGAQSHAEGTETTASGNYSHAEGKKQRLVILALTQRGRKQRPHQVWPMQKVT